MFLSADADRPKAAVDAGLAVADSRFTYAIGKLVLWSKSLDLTKGDETLKANAFAKLSIANPTSAPYGAAAVEAMTKLGVYDAIQPKIVQGASIAQAFEFIDTGNAELGFVALVAIVGRRRGIALARAADALRADPAGRGAAENRRRRRSVQGVPRLPQGPGGARDHREVRLQPRVNRNAPRLPTDLLQPVELTLELATVTTIALRHHRHAARLVAGALARLVEGGVAAVVSLPIVLPPTVLGFYLLVALGPHGPGGALARLWGARTLAFTFGGLVVGSVVYSLPFVVQPIRNAFAAIGDRPLEVAATLRASPSRAFFDRRAAAGEPRPADRRGARLRPHRRRVRRRADDRRHHPRPHRGRVDDDLRLRRDAASGARPTSLAAGMVVFAFVVILAMIAIEKRFARGRP